MYGGETVRVTLEGQNHMAGALIDRFGKDISIIPLDEAHFRAHVDVIASPHFFGWVTSLGDGIRITGPEEVLNEMKAVAKRLSEILNGKQPGYAGRSIKNHPVPQRRYGMVFYRIYRMCRMLPTLAPPGIIRRSSPVTQRVRITAIRYTITAAAMERSMLRASPIFPAPCRSRSARR